MKRDYSLDLLRIFLCVCVIAYHSLTHFGTAFSNTINYVHVFLLQANGLFYILSGYFNLNKTFDDINSIKKFYKDKIITIFIPFITFVFVFFVWEYCHNHVFNLLEFLSLFYETIMDTTANTHLWFMYPLFGFLLATPFLSRLLHGLDDKELKFLWRIIIGFNIVYYFLCSNFDISLRVSWIFDGWTIYYFAGYYFRRIITKENSFKWIALGVIGYFFTVFGISYYLPIFKSFNSGTDLQPMFTFYCLGCLYIWTRLVSVKKEKVGGILRYISANTFFIYMYHMRAVEFVSKRITFVGSGFAKGTLVVLIAFVISLLAAIITYMLIKPIQTFVKKRWVIE